MGPIWGVTMNEKNQQLLWDPICGYCDEWKTSDYYEILYADIAYFGKISNVYYKILYASIALNSNTQCLLWDPYVGFAFL